MTVTLQANGVSGGKTQPYATFITMSSAGPQVGYYEFTNILPAKNNTVVSVGIQGSPPTIQFGAAGYVQGFAADFSNGKTPKTFRVSYQSPPPANQMLNPMNMYVWPEGGVAITTKDSTATPVPNVNVQFTVVQVAVTGQSANYTYPTAAGPGTPRRSPSTPHSRRAGLVELRHTAPLGR